MAANKTDMADEASLGPLRRYAEQNGMEMIPMCAAIGEGISQLKERIAEMLLCLPPVESFESEIVVADTWEKPDDTVRVRNENGVFVVEGERLVNVVRSINFTDRESLAYFQKVLRKSGVFDALEKKGIHEGDTVKVYDAEFEYYR